MTQNQTPSDHGDHHPPQQYGNTADVHTTDHTPQECCEQCLKCPDYPSSKGHMDYKTRKPYCHDKNCPCHTPQPRTVEVWALFEKGEFVTADLERSKVRYMRDNLKKYGVGNLKIIKCKLTKHHD